MSLTLASGPLSDAAFGRFSSVEVPLLSATPRSAFFLPSMSSSAAVINTSLGMVSPSATVKVSGVVTRPESVAQLFFARTPMSLTFSPTPNWVTLLVNPKSSRSGSPVVSDGSEHLEVAVNVSVSTSPSVFVSVIVAVPLATASVIVPYGSATTTGPSAVADGDAPTSTVAPAMAAAPTNAARPFRPSFHMAALPDSVHGSRRQSLTRPSPPGTMSSITLTPSRAMSTCTVAVARAAFASTSTSSSVRSGSWWKRSTRRAPAASASFTAYSAAAWPKCPRTGSSAFVYWASWMRRSAPAASSSAASWSAPVPSSPGPRSWGA